MTNNPIRAMGIDFGLKYIGVAYGQTLTATAKPLETLIAKEGSIPWPTLERLIAEWHPDIFIVGLPLNMDGTDQKITKKARAFATTLEEKFHIPVELFDERLSTVEAKAHLFEKGGFKALQKTRIDAMAAKIILESWMADNA
jgi:putative holliday junction resolvase